MLGANDGILSTGSLIVGVAAAHSGHHSIVIAGAASLVAGAMSMATGEFVSVSSQSDTERAELRQEQRELDTNIKGERKELANIYVNRGLTPDLAKQVAEQLMAHDALGAHARDELGISPAAQAHPVQAAFVSAATFSVGSALPLVMIFVAPANQLIPAVIAASLLFLAALGALAAHTGGANVWRGAVRVTCWGALAMGLTAGIGALSS